MSRYPACAKTLRNQVKALVRPEVAPVTADPEQQDHERPSGRGYGTRTGASPAERPQFRDTNSRILKASKQLRVMTHHKIQTLTDLVAPHPSLVVTLPGRRMLIFFLRITSTNHSPPAALSPTGQRTRPPRGAPSGLVSMLPNLG